MEKILVGDLKLGPEEKSAVNEIMDSNRVSEGKFVRLFEKEWAEYVGTKYAIAISSGTSALLAGLLALRHKKGLKLDEKKKIITTPLTYIATSNAIIHSDFEPVFVDVNDDFTLNAGQIEIILEEANDPGDFFALLPVHLLGNICDMKKISSIAKKFGLFVFEDSAQAHGSVQDGKRAGSFGELSEFSFYIAHNIQAGEMGAINTNDQEIFRLIKKIKANGRLCDCEICTRSKGQCPKILANKSEDDIDPRFTHDMIGLNFKTMEFPAAIASCQLKKADWIMKKRQENVKYLNGELEDMQQYLKLPEFSRDISYLAYPLIIKEKNGVSRKELRMKLEAKGIESRPLFGSIPEQPCFGFLKKKYEGKLPKARFLGRNGFYVGCHQYLEKEQLDRMASAIKETIKETK